MDDRDTARLGRREVLAASATAVGVGASGCLATLPPLGRRIRYGRIDTPPGGDPTYRQWIPADSALQPFTDDPDISTSGFLYAEPDTDRPGWQRNVIDFPHDIHVAVSDYVGVDYTDFEWALRVGRAFVGRGDIDRSAVRKTLGQTGYERAASKNEYDLYTRADGPRALAVGGDAIVNARTDAVETARGWVEAVLDASAGEVDRRHEVDDDFATVIDIAGAQPFVWAGAPRTSDWEPEPVTGVSSGAFDDDAVYYLWDDLYASASETPSVETVKQKLESEQRARNSRLADVTVDGRHLSIEFRQDPSTVRDDEDPRKPYTTWGVEDETTSGRVTFHYEAGPPIDRTQLAIYPRYGFEGDGPFSGRGTLRPGDSVSMVTTKEADSRYDIRWTGEGDLTRNGTSLFGYTLGRGTE